MQQPQAHWLPDGKRLHLNHGPIDLIIEAFGEPREIEAAYAQAIDRFQTILTELVAELPDLRKAVEPHSNRISTSVNVSLSGSTAMRMYAAVLPHARNFITPMAAVAGSVADEIMAAMMADRIMGKAYVNNGGDIALHLEPGDTLNIAVAGTSHGFAAGITVRANDPVRGVATSGWRGRSFSLGIADAVTVLARTGAQADAAATIIANAVDLPGHPTVSRRPANELAPDSDLGDRRVTVGVGPLTVDETAMALERGLTVAENLRRRGLIEAAALFLAGEYRLCGSLAEASRSFAPPSVLPDISPASGEISSPTANLPPCGGDVRQDRGGATKR